ncbi:MAG: hypothetical protein JO036_16925 [Candidatus Eremiobacteraeota bacterium]|nr:hypothetical protein [Candidatus Eremiobacteraeota bacterium]
MLRYVATALIIGLMVIASAEVSAETTDVRLRVVFYPAIITPPLDGKTQARFTSDQVTTNLLNDISAQISKAHPLYFPCFYDLSKPASADCNPTLANVLITTQFTPDPKTDAAHPDWIVTMRSLDMINGRIISTQPLGTLKESDLGAAVSANNPDPVAAALKALAPSADVITKLIGTISISNGKLALFQGYEPYVQLVPALANANDPAYLGLMTNLLDRRNIPSIPSQFNAGVVASGNTPLDTICGRGQRYLVYSLTSEQYPHQVNMSTRIQTQASAQLYDCTTMSVIPVGLDQHVSVLTTKGPLTSLLAIIQGAFFWQQKTVSPVPLNVIGLVSPFVDADPASDPVKHSVADRALQGLVDRLCDRLDKLAAPSPAPPVPSLYVRVATAPTPQMKRLKLQLKQATDRETAAQKAMRVAKTDEEKVRARNAAEAAKLEIYNASVQLNQAFAGEEKAAGPPPGTPQPPAVTPATQPTVQTGTALQALDITGFLSATPPPLKCDGDKLDRWSGTSADTGRWHQPPPR